MALKNVAFCEPIETITESYGLPGKGEIDPTFIMSFFHYILFGIMLSDIAYGIIIFLGSFFALKKIKNLGDETKKNLKMFLGCGISTFFWGIMFGSFFGDLIQVVAFKFFSCEVNISPLWFEPAKSPMAMLGFSLIFGIIHIFAGLGMKFYSLFKTQDYKSLIFDVIFWYLLVGSLIVLAASSFMIQKMFGVSLIVPDFVTKFLIICVLISTFGIIFTAGRSQKVL